MINKYVIAVSGGVDSMYLATKLSSQNQAAAFVHINHHTRGQDNEYELNLVHHLGEKYNIPVYVFDYFHIDGNFQAKAREFRYQKLLEVARKYHYKIAVAHHLDDQLENCLLPKHIVKSNLMRYRSKLEDCYVYRPLLGYHKSYIYSLAHELGIEYNEDVSNSSDKYERNKNRILLTEVKYQHIAKVAYIVEYSKQQIVFNKFNDSLDRKLLREKNSQFRMAEIYYFIKYIDSEITVKNKQLQAISDLICSPGNCKYTVSNSVELFIGYDKIYMLASDGEIITKACLQTGENEFNGIVFESNVSTGYIRTWQQGDKIEIKNGHKKVSRLFIDKKIDHPLRSKWPIIINDGGEIIEIPHLWRKNEIN
ncbi:tRNA lysidine(34) synthetase TilS [Mollicutes bacterium LVI A0078]|nr:tRNA lysidine(34) synthetase TilS [Mollicutes bacterium LVI A0075]WOO90629.1 tRNA lysidine(34) synthetase TilS [Mollicutes bacterium LVI A0078]